MINTADVVDDGSDDVDVLANAVNVDAVDDPVDVEAVGWWSG